MADDATTKMVIASKLTEVPRVQQAVREEIEQHGYGEDTTFAVRLALEEALSNAIKHGNDGDESKTVTIDYQVDEHEIRISVTDEGAGFNRDCLPDPRAEENLTRPHGRGVMLMEAYMTEVAYNASGNCVTMVRTRDGAPADAE